MELMHEPPHADILAQWDIYENPPVLGKDGNIKMPDAPGLGDTIKSDLMQEMT